MSSLYDELDEAKLTCQLTGKKYIASKVLDEKMTWESIEKSLPRTLFRRWLPCWDYELSRKIQGAKNVIATLMLIGRQSTLESLLLGEPESPELMDRDLPLARSGVNIQSSCGKKVFKSFSNWERGAIDLFLNTQWMFLKPEFELDPTTSISIELSENCPVQPAFASFEKITKVPSEVNVYKAELNSESQCGHTYVAIKAFKQPQVKAFTKERENLEALQSNSIKNQHLVQHLAICETVRCIIFPYAGEGDLGDFWELECPKAAPEFLWSFRQIAGLAHGIEDLHRVNIRHGDLKPANILCYLENGTRVLKITDFGISRVHSQNTVERVNKTVTSASTKAYEAPEVVLKGKLSRQYDCWSMGCIVLEFVIWLLYDYDALLSFVRARDSDNCGYYRRRSSVSSFQNSNLTDKVEVHPAVYDGIKDLLADPRCDSTALQDIVILVREDLLQIEYEKRLKAGKLHEKLQAILERAQIDSAYLMNGADPPVEIPATFCLPPSTASPQSTFSSAFQSSS